MIRAKVKELFFDRKAVQDAVSRAERKVLSRFGAFVRQRARGLIRTRRRTSNPGDPPSSHVGLYKRNIFFAYDRSERSVFIGPVLLREGSTVPSALEHGGMSFVIEPRLGIKRRRQITVAARPHMRPAFEAELPKAAGLWKNQVKR